MQKVASANKVMTRVSSLSYDPSFDDAEGDDLDAFDDVALDDSSSVGKVSALSGVVPGVSHSICVT